MIQNKKDLHFYIAADRIMNGLPMHKSLKEQMVNIFDKPIRGGQIVKFLCALRHYEYYKNTLKKKTSFEAILMLCWHRRLNKLSLKLGFSIGPNSLGYGAVIPHHGTIIVNGEARIGNFAVLHTSTCIAGGDKNIGDFFYLSTGSQVVGSVHIGNGVTVAAHSLVNKSVEGNCLLAGAPANVKKENYPIWVDRGDGNYKKRVETVLELRNKLV